MADHAERLGLPVVEFVDNDFSASRYARRKRPAYLDMIRRVEAGEIRHVVLWELGRLTRQPKELEALIDLADAGTVEVHTLTGRIDLRDPDGRAWARQITTMNARESDMTSKRIKAQQAQAREMGRYHGGARPFGFEGRGAKVRDSERVLIVEAALRVLKGEGLLTIARDWDARGLPTPTTLGDCLRALWGHEVGPVSRWSTKTIREALLRPLTVQAGIISADVQTELGAVLTDPARRRAWSTARTHLLAGLMRCGRCGEDGVTMKLRSKPRADGRPTYTCNRCHVTRLAEPLDAFVTEALFVALDGPGLARAVRQQEDDDPEVAQLVAALEGYEGRLRTLEAEFEDGGVDMASFKRMKASLDGKMTDARRALARRMERRVAIDLPVGEALQSWWEQATMDARRALIAALLESITILPAHRGPRRFDPTKVQLVWRA